MAISSTRTVLAAGGVSIPVLRLWVDLAFARRAGDPLLRECLIDTGAPLSVVPHHISQRDGLAWQPLSGPWPSGLTTWMGVPCAVGRTDVWVSLPDPPYFRGPFPFIAKFPQATPTNVSGAIPILLGLNFLADHSAEATFQCHTPPGAGSVVLP